MATRVLITGIAGFVGAHLARYLAGVQPVEIYGIDRDGTSSVEAERSLGAALHRLSGDLTDAARTREMVRSIRPEWVFHLAAQSSIGAAWDDPAGTIVNNIVCQINLLEGILASGCNPTILVICSAEEYGRVGPDEIPVSEEAPLKPADPYSVSKVAQDMLGYQYHVGRHLSIVRVRPFNHIGPGQSDRFVTSSFARQVAEAELGLRSPVLQVGNLEVERDFTDVRDMVRAYHLAVTKATPGEVYNIGSERAVSIRGVLELLLSFSRVPVRIEKDPDRWRPAEVPIMVGDCAKFRAATGWKAEIPLERTLSDILDYWRERLATEQS